MNKYLAFKELRRELASSYEEELQAIAKADANADLSVKIGDLVLDFADSESQLAGSEARKILHEEMRGNLQALLERYDRNLRGEAVGLGLELRGIAAATAVRDGLSDAEDRWASPAMKQAEASKFSSELGVGSRLSSSEPLDEVPAVPSVQSSSIEDDDNDIAPPSLEDNVPAVAAPKGDVDPFENLIKNIEEEYAAKTRDSGNAA